ncbi:MAG: DnaA/Hda family protein, partial [Pseudomonadota bacterium]
GETGLGKTHLLSAIAGACSGTKVLMANTIDLIAEAVRAVRLDAIAEFRGWLLGHDVLLLDDIQSCEGNEEFQIELISVLNHMTGIGRRVVITSDVHPAGLTGIDSRLLSRIGGGVVAGLQMPDNQERLEMLTMFMGDLTCPDEVMTFLADRMTESIRQLKAAALQLTALAQRGDGRVTMTIAREVVAAISGSPAAPNGFIADERIGDETYSDTESSELTADRFKAMLEGAETEEEQVLALQIAVGERIRQLRNDGNQPQHLQRLEGVLVMLREGDTEGAMMLMNE